MGAASDTRDRLLTAAGALFARRGYDAVPVRDICHRARANIGAVNYYFGGKQRLYLEAVRQAAQTLLSDVPVPTWPAETPAGQRLHDFVLAFLLRIVVDRDPSWRSGLIMREMLHPTEACQRFVREFVKPQFRVLLEIVQQLTENRDSPETAQRFAFSVIGQCLFYRVARPVIANLTGQQSFDKHDAERLAEHIVRFSLAAVHAYPREARRTPRAKRIDSSTKNGSKPARSTRPTRRRQPSGSQRGGK